jgi:hypothetical protein
MPKYDDEEAYDVGGDSFQKMLSDLLRGAAISAAGVCPGVAVAFFSSSWRTTLRDIPPHRERRTMCNCESCSPLVLYRRWDENG